MVKEGGCWRVVRRGGVCWGDGEGGETPMVKLHETASSAAGAACWAGFGDGGSKKRKARSRSSFGPELRPLEIVNKAEKPSLSSEYGRDESAVTPCESIAHPALSFGQGRLETRSLRCSLLFVISLDPVRFAQIPREEDDPSFSIRYQPSSRAGCAPAISLHGSEAVDVCCAGYVQPNRSSRARRKESRAVAKRPAASLTNWGS